MNFLLRAPTPADFRTLASWIADAHACARWAGPKLAFPFATEDLPALLCSDGARCYAFVDAATQLAGFGELTARANRTVHLSRVIVAPDRRGCGLGTRLCRSLVDEARMQPGARQLTLFVYRDNLAAMRIYTRLGFAEVLPPDRRPEVAFMQCPL